MELVFNPTYTTKLKSCGIMYLDSPTDIMPIALNYIGKPAFRQPRRLRNGNGYVKKSAR